MSDDPVQDATAPPAEGHAAEVEGGDAAPSRADAAPPAGPALEVTDESPAGDPARATTEDGLPALEDLDNPFPEETRATDPLAAGRRKRRHADRRKRKAHVVVRRTGSAPAKVAMDRDELTFGRDPGACDIVLDGTRVSRVHAIIERNERGYFRLRDNRSKNGTLVGGRPINSMNLVDGDTFTVGGHEIEFHVD